MGSSCKEVAEALVACLKQSKCVKDGGEIKKCLGTEESCQTLRNAYSTCRRQALDMRTRIRGPRVY